MAEIGCEYDVIIIGGGPVGVGLAIDLAIHGHRSIIVERHETIQQIPKGQNLTPRTGEHFRRWGVTEAIRGGIRHRAMECTGDASCAIGGTGTRRRLFGGDQTRPADAAHQRRCHGVL